MGLRYFGKAPLGVDAGLKCSPMNNGIIGIEARTHHNPLFNGQYVYLNVLGIPIKQLYRVESFHHNYGPEMLD